MRSDIREFLRIAGVGETETTVDGYAGMRLHLLTTDELATLLRRDPSTLRRWRTSRPPQGPPFLRLSDGVTMYDLADVRLWLARSRIDPREAA
jgi:hypothetical protein